MRSKEPLSSLQARAFRSSLQGVKKVFRKKNEKKHIFHVTRLKVSLRWAAHWGPYRLVV